MLAGRNLVVSPRLCATVPFFSTRGMPSLRVSSFPPLRALSWTLCVLFLFSAGCVPPKHGSQGTDIARYVCTPKVRPNPAKIRARAKRDREEMLAEALSTEQVYIDLFAELELGIGSLMSPGALADVIRSLVGIPYKWGGVTQRGLDCSGFTQMVYRKLGVNLPRTSREQARVGVSVPRNSLQVGDLVFFSVQNDHIDHVGIVVGKNQIAHATSRRGRVVIEPLSSVYPSCFTTARRPGIRGR